MDPLIVCLCLAHTNQDFVLRSRGSFESQDYQNRALAWMDTRGKGATIGELRNSVLRIATSGEDIGFPRPCDYIAHWDYDDVSAPDRLSLQLAHIQKTGKLLTGFYDMALYDVANDKTWIYSNEDHRYALGTSLFYRREAWERVKFPEKTPEDNIWRKEVGLDNCESQSCFREDGSPIMVQTVHGGNASARIFPSSHRYKRASSLQDEQIRELLK